MIAFYIHFSKRKEKKDIFFEKKCSAGVTFPLLSRHLYRNDARDQFPTRYIAAEK